MIDFDYDKDKIIFVMAKANCTPTQIARRLALINFTRSRETKELGISWDIASVTSRQEWLSNNFKTLLQLKHYYDYSLGGDTL